MILLHCEPFSSSKKLIEIFVRVLRASVFETKIDIELRRSRELFNKYDDSSSYTEWTLCTNIYFETTD